MKHTDSSTMRRFGAYLLDLIIMSVFISIFAAIIIFPNTKADDEMLRILEEIANDPYLSDDAMARFSSEFMAHTRTLILPILGLHLVVRTLYMCVLPYFWSKQTLGRLITNTRVVFIQEEAKVSFPRLLLRELLGGLIITEWISGMTIILLIAVIVYTCSTKRSVADVVGGTRLINLGGEIPQDEKSEGYFRHFEDSVRDDSIEAKFKPADEDFDDSSEDKSNDSSKDKSNHSSDEYQVF